jgi:hypothetical protein
MVGSRVEWFTGTSILDVFQPDPEGVGVLQNKPTQPCLRLVSHENFPSVKVEVVPVNPFGFGWAKSTEHTETVVSQHRRKVFFTDSQQFFNLLRGVNRNLSPPHLDRDFIGGLSFTKFFSTHQLKKFFKN